MNRFQTTFRLLLTAALLLATAVALSATRAPAKRSTALAAAKGAAAVCADPRCPDTKCLDTKSVAATPGAAKQPAAKPNAVAPKGPAVATQAPAPAQVAPGTAGLRIYLDPETGTFGGNGAALANDIDPLNDSVEGLTEVRMPDGSYMLDMKGRFAEYAVVQTDANGKLVFRCVRSRNELLQPAPAPREDR